MAQPAAVIPDHAKPDPAEIPSKTERGKMIAGLPYNAYDPDLVKQRLNARVLLRELNSSDPTEENIHAKRDAIVRKLVAKCGKSPEVEPPFWCDYGYNLVLGDNFYCNFNCTILDCGPVTIGNRVAFGPGVQVYAATHPTDVVQRRAGVEISKPVVIGDDCWIGGNSIILPGVTIGRGVTVAAGSVVTKNIEPYVVVAGNPAKKIKDVPRPPDDP